jgi:hypothetical protein
LTSRAFLNFGTTLVKCYLKIAGFCLPFLYLLSATLSVQGRRASLRSQVTLCVILDPPGNLAEKKKLQAS